MALLTQAELEGVLAHELSHILNRDTLTQAVAATIGGAISALTYFAQWASYSNRDGQGRFGSNPIGLLLAVFVAPLIQMSISRNREFAADARAGQLTKNSLALPSALCQLEGSAQKAPMLGNPAFEPLLIVTAFAKQGLSNLFATYPDTAARIAAVESQA